MKSSTRSAGSRHCDDLRLPLGRDKMSLTRRSSRDQTRCHQPLPKRGRPAEYFQKVLQPPMRLSLLRILTLSFTTTYLPATSVCHCTYSRCHQSNDSPPLSPLQLPPSSRWLHRHNRSRDDGLSYRLVPPHQLLNIHSNIVEL